MSHTGMSLLEVLDPPGNPWLAKLARDKADIPTGVRIVRHSDGDIDMIESGTGLRAIRRKARETAEG